MNNFFDVREDTTPDDLQRRYRRLCKRHHPDRGGSDETQAQINAEYRQALEQLSAMAAKSGNDETAEAIRRILEQHALKMLAELKTPVIQRYVPAQYQGLAFEIAKLFEEKIGEGRKGKV